MHMADALISPLVGGSTLLGAGVLLAHCARKVQSEGKEELVPVMGVLGAFVFAAQMINFPIPGTGSSGHLGGALLLAILLGPHAAFLVIASVLTVQAFLFADGGLLALGCNMLNMGFFPAFVVYPLFRIISRGQRQGRHFWIACLVAAVLGLLLGAMSVVVETKLSGITALPFTHFLLLMLPIHAAIGLVEGLATAAVLNFVAQLRPEILQRHLPARQDLRPMLVIFAGMSMLVGGLFSWFASSDPDGLEWSIARVSGQEELSAPANSFHAWFTELQEKSAILPDYDFSSSVAETEASPENGPTWPDVRVGTSVSGVLGSFLTLALVMLAVRALRLVAQRW